MVLGGFLFGEPVVVAVCEFGVVGLPSLESGYGVDRAVEVFGSYAYRQG